MDTSYKFFHRFLKVRMTNSLHKVLKNERVFNVFLNARNIVNEGQALER